MGREPLGNVLVATDFSEHADLALQRALGLPIGPRARVELLHVAEGGAENREASRVLEEVRREVAPSGVEVVTSLVGGPPAAVIVDRARHGRATLVVLGRHGARRVRDAWMGSTVERVIRRGSVSVLVVGSPPRASYRRPLVAIDMSESSRFAFELTSRICDPELEKVDVVHVLAMPSRLRVSETHLVPALERRLDDLKREASGMVAEFIASARAERPCNIIVGCGDPRAVILAEATAREADLIAVGTKGRSGLPRALLGSVAEGVLRAAPTDVLVARLPESGS